MPTGSERSPRPLPEHPDLRHLKDQAKALKREGRAVSLAQAQFQIAEEYGFASWPKLKAHVDSMQAALREVAALKQAIDSEDFSQVRQLMTRNPALHQAPLGYGKNGPLTWVAECRVPWQAPSTVRLAMAQWMIDNGSDVHQGGDGPMMRAALDDCRIPMMELLVRNGADVNAEWNGDFPIIFAPCETVEPAALKWLLDHGADPNCRNTISRNSDSALDYVIGTYLRSKQLGRCIDLLIAAGCRSRIKTPAVLEILRGRTELLAECLDKEPSLVEQRFEALDFGATGGRRLTLRGGTLLHVAAEYGNLDAAKLLVQRGADVNARTTLDEAGVGAQTPIFHAASQGHDWGFAVVEFLVQKGADLSVRARLPGHYERLDEVVDGTPLSYAMLFSGDSDNAGRSSKTITFLRELASR